jgi:hypothetical protein
MRPYAAMPRTTLTLTVLLAAAFPCAAVAMTAAQSSSTNTASSEGALPDAVAAVKRAKELMGGDAWDKIRSFESSASLRSAMGDARVEFRFVAPDSFELIQSMPGGGRTMTMGSANGVAWIGEPGRERAADPRMTAEMRDGGDLQVLVRTISERFTGFRTVARAEDGGRTVLRIEMRPKQAPPDAPAWMLLVDATTGMIHGVEIPAPPAPPSSAAGAQKTFGQSIRVRRWEPVTAAADAARAAPLLAFREATVESGGTKTDIVYDRITVDGLAADAVKAPVAAAARK